MPDPSLTDRVTHALRHRVAPALDLDGSGIEVVAVANGIATVRLSGACAGCPVTILALVTGLEAELIKHVPEVEILEVVP
jgi:Fe-S cluster biogenesis protein NfuA